MESFNVRAVFRRVSVFLLAVSASTELGAYSMDGVSECALYGNGDPCKCRLASNPAFGLDLTPIRALFASPHEGFEEQQYVWGPCGDVLDYSADCSPQSNAAACQGPRVGEPPNWNSLGTVLSATFEVEMLGDKVTTTLNYTGGTDGRSSTFTLVCDESSNGTFVFVGQSPTLNYLFTITSNASCLVPVYTPAPPSSKTSLSAGSIVLIIVLVLGVVYMAGGVLYNRVARGATGVEVIPNRDTWMLFPELILDGVTFILSPCQGSGKSGRKMRYERL